jgi:hypothetical protein
MNERRSGNDRRKVTFEQIEYLRVQAEGALEAGRTEDEFIFGKMKPDLTRTGGLLSVWHSLGRELYRDMQAEKKAVA